MVKADPPDGQPPEDPHGANVRTAVMFALYVAVIVAGLVLFTTIGALGR